MGLFDPHASNNNIFGVPVPDFGATETLSNFFGQGRTDAGGSNLFGDQNQTTQVPASGSGSVNFAPLGSTAAYGNTPYKAPPPQGQVLAVKQQSGNSGGNNPNTNYVTRNGETKKLSDWLGEGIDPFATAEDAARAEDQALLSRLNSEYDYNAEQLQGQLGTLGLNKQNSIETLNNEFSNVQNQYTKSKNNAQLQGDKQIKEAGSIARSTQAQSRNVLRALGILNSSAAGELLSKPLNAFDETRAGIKEVVAQRFSELDDFLNTEVSRHATSVRQIESQYTDLVGKIQSDMRFNDRQRAAAVQQANAALLSNLSAIQNSMLNYKTQVDLQKQQIAQSLAGVNSYQQPNFDRSKISSTSLTTPEQQRQTVGISQNSPEDIRRRQTLSGFSA